MSIRDDLIESVLQLAIQGKITKQLQSDGLAIDILKYIQTRKSKNYKFKNVDILEYPFEIPNNWIWVKLKDILEVGLSNGKSPKGVEYKTPYKNLTLTATSSGYFKDNAFKYINLTESEAEKYWIKNNDILIQRSNSRELVGTSCIYKGKDNIFVYPDLIMRMHCFDNISNEYIDYVLKSPLTRRYYQKKASGTSQSMPKINQKIVNNTLIPLPPLPEQLRIVKKLDILISKIKELGESEDKLNKIKREFKNDIKESILKEAIEGRLTRRLESDEDSSILFKKYNVNEINSSKVIGEIPPKWHLAKLNDICLIYTGNSIPKKKKQDQYTGLNNGYDYIGTKDVKFDYTIQYDNGVKIPFDEDKFKIAKKDSILMCIEGGSAGRKIAILDKNVCFGNKLCMLYPKFIDKKFLFYYLQSPVFQHIFKTNMTGIIGGVGINKIRATIIPIPPIEEQKRIVKKIELLNQYY